MNETFAMATVMALKQALEEDPGDSPIIWIHDYHLMEVANIVRRTVEAENLSCKIGKINILTWTLPCTGFFCHVPFPPWDMVKIHPWKDIWLQVSCRPST